MRGQFKFWLPDGELVVPNTVTELGDTAFMKMVVRGDASLIAVDGNFYMGLCTIASPSRDTVIGDIVEPSAAGGYARQAITRNASGWPTVDVVNSSVRGATNILNFTATGADFSMGINRAFLASALTGGTLLAFSAALPTEQDILSGQTLPTQYELFFR